MVRKNQEGNILVILILLVIIGGALGGAYYLKMQSPTSSDGEASQMSDDVLPSDLVGKSTAEITKLFGDPDASTSNSPLAKDIWVYFMSDEDSTATYFYFKNGIVVQTKQDEFNGSFDADTWFDQP